MASALQQLWSFRPPRAASLEEQKTLELSPVHLPPALGLVAFPVSLLHLCKTLQAEMEQKSQRSPSCVLFLSKWCWLLSGAQAWQAGSPGVAQAGTWPQLRPPQLPRLGQRFAQPILCGTLCRKQEGLWSVPGTEIQGPRGSWLKAALCLCHQRPQGQGDTGTGNTTSPGPNTSIPLSACGPDRCWLIANKHLFVYW